MNYFKLPLAASLLFLTACAGGEGSDNAPKVQEYVIKGDPNLIIEGAALNPNTPFTIDNIQMLSEYSIAAAVIFTEQSKKVLAPQTSDELKNKDAPREEKKEQPNYNFTVQQLDANRFLAENKELSFGLYFVSDAQGRLQLQKLAAQDEELEVKVLHWSESTDKSMMSVLVSTNSEETKHAIAAYYFKKDSALKTIPLYDKIYKYLAGAGVGVGWDADKEVLVEICGKNQDPELVKKSVAQWSQQLEGRLKINLQKAPSYGPFSDLNQRCIYEVDIYDKDPANLNYGTNFAILNLSLGRIIDSDIVIFNRAFRKHAELLAAENVDINTIQASLQKYRSITYVHELGHFFGLDHKFDGADSVMSYDFRSPQLTYYDKTAIQTLYSVQKPKPEEPSTKNEASTRLGHNDPRPKPNPRR